MNENIILMDGAIGTSLWEKADDKVPVWRYNIENPAIVSELHKEYIAAGSQMILANTFGANRLAMRGTDYTPEQIVKAGMKLAKDASDGKAKIMLSAGPLPILMEPYGDLTEEEAYNIFDEQLTAGVEEGPDCIYLQTFIDVEMLKVAVKAASRHNLPVFCSMSFEPIGKTIMGNSVQDMVDALKDFPCVKAIGLNCSLGPDAAVPIMEQFQKATDLPLIFKPNAGKPAMVGADGTSTMEFDAATFVEDSLPVLQYGIKYIGGCCGSNPTYIQKLHEGLAKM